MTHTDLLDLARAVATETRDLILAGRASAEVAATKSSSIDIVTQVDIQAEHLLRERLAQARPDDAILGEEGDDVQGTSGITWILDPIDGTVNYLYGIPHFSVSVAAVEGPARAHEWRPLVAAVADGSGTLWSAAHGEGAWRDGEPVVRTEGPTLEATLLGTGFQYVAERRVRQAEILAGVIGQVRDIRRLGSASVDLCLVAGGVLDAYYEHGLNAWDFAGGALIAQEAGIKVAGIDGGPADERLLIAAAPHAWEAVRDALVAAGADRSW